MSNKLVDEQTAFFCIADSGAYAPMVIATLSSVRRFHAKAKFFVIGPFRDDATALELLSQNDIQFQYLDLAHVFRGTERIDTMPREWPSECFWWTYAYKLLADQGFEFSCFLDGDVLCVSPLDLEAVFEDEITISGVAKPNGRINSGVLFFHHKNMLEFEFFEKILHIYNKEKVCSHPQCTGYCREKGDQGLLWEAERLFELRVRRLQNAYNHMLSWEVDLYLERNSEAPFNIDESRLLHLLSKPWLEPYEPGVSNPVAIDAYHAWWDYVSELFPNPEHRRRWFGFTDAKSAAQP